MKRVIFHVDMDAFFAAVEQRDRPELRGKPVIVGGLGRRGVVSTASYEARVFGVGSAMPTAKAKQLCPHAVFLAPRMHAYREASDKIMRVFSEFSPLVEPLSVDEAFLDLSGTDKLFGPPQRVAKTLQERVLHETQLTCSIGMAPNKFLAKLTSALHKPNGITNFLVEDIPQRLAPLPLKKLWGVGPKTLGRLNSMGFHTFGDLQSSSESTLSYHFGALGEKLHALSFGRDEREVSPGSERKSIGSENTFQNDICGKAEIVQQFRRQCRTVAKALRGKKIRAGGVRIKVRYAEGFQTHTAQTKLPNFVQDSSSLLAAAEKLLERVDTDRPLRLVGVTAFELVPESASPQMSLFQTENEPQKKQEAVEHLKDAIAQRFGESIFKET